MKIEDKQKLS